MKWRKKFWTDSRLLLGGRRIPVLLVVRQLLLPRRCQRLAPCLLLSLQVGGLLRLSYRYLLNHILLLQLQRCRLRCLLLFLLLLLPRVARPGLLLLPPHRRRRRPCARPLRPELLTARLVLEPWWLAAEDERE